MLLRATYFQSSGVLISLLITNHRFQNIEWTRLPHLLEFVVVSNQNRTGETQSIDGDPMPVFARAWDNQHPVARQEQVVRLSDVVNTHGRAGAAIELLEFGATSAVQAVSVEGRPRVSERQIRHRRRYADLRRRGKDLVEGRRMQGGPHREWNELQVFVALARAGHRSTVVEAETVHLVHAFGEGLEVFTVQRHFLGLEPPGDDQKVEIQHVELVENADVAGRDIADEEFGIRGEERVEVVIDLPAFGLSLAFLEGCDVDDKRDSAILDDRRLRWYRDQGSPLHRSIGDRSDLVLE